MLFFPAIFTEKEEAKSLLSLGFMGREKQRAKGRARVVSDMNKSSGPTSCVSR